MITTMEEFIEYIKSPSCEISIRMPKNEFASMIDCSKVGSCGVCKIRGFCGMPCEAPQNERIADYLFKHQMYPWLFI